MSKIKNALPGVVVKPQPPDFSTAAERAMIAGLHAFKPTDAETDAGARRVSEAMAAAARIARASASPTLVLQFETDAAGKLSFTFKQSGAAS